MKIGLASPPIAASVEEGMENVSRLMSEASLGGAEIVCFPEAYIPGLRGQDFEVPTFDQKQQERALDAVSMMARRYSLTVILGMEKHSQIGNQIAAYVIDSQGKIQGHQTKNQLDPSETPFYVPGNTRRIFEVHKVKFGITICHEGWRYPETVRWAAVRGAKIVFHPQLTGSNQAGVSLKEWGDSRAPYYEKAMVMRSIENTIYFASVNYAMRFQESATALIDPSGNCQAYLPYGEEGVLIQTIQPEIATGFLAERYAPDRYQDSN